MTATRTPEDTRRKILFAAFTEFYKNGFQGGSINLIVESAGITKGALFHHFENKHALGYAVVDEVILPILNQRWIDPLANSTDPITDLKGLFRRFIREDIASGHIAQGCPLNNLAQEMSPLDAGFHQRIDRLYTHWRESLAAALQRGVKSGTIAKHVSPLSPAALIVASQMGIWGTGKSSQNAELMIQAGEALCGYLDSLKPSNV
jgi:TetR/AcrR family transcriptional regulator, transcriptional repressor for nem operon